MFNSTYCKYGHQVLSNKSICDVCEREIKSLESALKAEAGVGLNAQLDSGSKTSVTFRVSTRKLI